MQDKRRFSNNDWIEVYREYVRLVESGDEDFLDVDTTLIIEDRDEIEERIEAGELNKEQFQEIEVTDRKFREKALACKARYEERIRNNAKDAEYLKMILESLRYSHMHNKQKWWFHLVD